MAATPKPAITKLASGQDGASFETKGKLTKGGRVHYEARTEDGVLVIVYVPADKAQRDLTGVAFKLEGPKVASKAKQPKAAASTDDLGL